MRQSTALDFAIALMVGDLVDDMIWAEVRAAQFVVACTALFALHSLVLIVRFRLRYAQ